MLNDVFGRFNELSGPRNPYTDHAKRVGPRSAEQSLEISDVRKADMLSVEIDVCYVPFADIRLTN